MTVYLLGAGPGDPGLLTVRGAQVLATAEVVVYDRLSQGAVLDLAAPQAELINVGKLPGQPRMSQTEINQLLVNKGQAHQSVVRLKGGDPMVFARGGEEAQALQAAGVEFEVVPGLSSAFAVPAYAGIPVTLRHSSTSVTVITGHEADVASAGESDAEVAAGAIGDAAAQPVNWEAAAQLGGTLVILMGVARWSAIAARLQQAGMSPATPVAAISWGTRPSQQTLRSTLAELDPQQLQAPSVIVVGEVAAQDLAWFENLALFGRKIAVTRPAAQSAGLSALLRANGAEPVEVPLIEIVAPTDQGSQLNQAVELLRGAYYSWVIFTSANAVRRLLAITHDARDFAGSQIAAIGPATAQALAEHNLQADLIPSRYVAEGLLAEFPDPDPANPTHRILLPRAEQARDVLPEGLTEKGWQVDVVSAYRAEPQELSETDRQALADCEVLTFMSPSAVAQFAAQCPELAAKPPAIACVGPITAEAARQAGLPVAIEAETYTAEGLVAALAASKARLDL